jgi:hypothetical protein
MAAQTTAASPFVSPDHWSYRVLRRLDAAGLLPRGADVARQTIPQEEIAALLGASQHPRATAYLRHFRREYHNPESPGFYHSSLRLSYSRSDDLVAPGTGYDVANWSGARDLEDVDDRDAGAAVSFSVTDWLALGVAQATDKFAELQLVLSHKIAGAWIGRREIGYAVGDGGGLVLNAHRFDGAGIFLTRPLRLPIVGATRFETHVSRIDNRLNLSGTENPIDPWFWTARASFEPVTNLRIAINRGMMFGGEGNVPVTFSRVAKNIIGIYTGDDENSFANQVLSVDIRYRVPGFPLSAYLDWGTDDAAGAGWDVPGILGGLELTRIDSTYDVAVGVEHLQFRGSCCGNSIWYRNAWFRGSWADGDELLGHPLGGHGREWRVFANGGIGERVLARAAFFVRRRRAENLFAPDRQGTSNGAQARTDIAVTQRARLWLGGEWEWGANDWNSSRLSATVRYIF